jgi:hypothetical protein
LLSWKTTHPPLSPLQLTTQCNRSNPPALLVLLSQRCVLACLASP